MINSSEHGTSSSYPEVNPEGHGVIFLRSCREIGNQV